MRGEIKLKLDIMKTSLDGTFIRFLELLTQSLFMDCPLAPTHQNMFNRCIIISKCFPWIIIKTLKNNFFATMGHSGLVYRVGTGPLLHLDYLADWPVTGREERRTALICLTQVHSGLNWGGR